MKAKPKGAKYRNLVARGEVIYFERVESGKRVRRSLETGDWNEAAATRDLWLLRRAQRGADGERTSATFGEIAARYLTEATSHLSASTGEDRARVLAPKGILTTYFGAMRLDAIRRATLLEWWHREVEGKGRSERTGLTYLSALSGVFGYAIDLELLDANPVDALRGTLRRRRRTKRGRAAEREETRNPIETPEQLRAFVAASRAAAQRRFANGRPRRERQLGHVADMLMLDAGLRLGEAAGLRWRDVVWGGEEAGDLARALVVREAIARGKHEGPPKSGRARTVALSRRLRGLLREFYIASGRPEPGERVLARWRGRNYQSRHFEPVCKAAGLPRHTPKDLRDTFASQLLTAGVQLGYIAEQLGHADVATTARHYARWAGGRAYRRPLEVEPGEVPADLLARIEGIESPHESPHIEAADER